MTQETLDKANQLEKTIFNAKKSILDLTGLIDNPHLQTKVFALSGSMTYEVIEIDPIPFLKAKLDEKVSRLAELQKEFESL